MSHGLWRRKTSYDQNDSNTKRTRVVYNLKRSASMLTIESSEQQRIRKMVFRGGGTKGLEHLGSIEELERNGAWLDVREVWGSSAGGIISMMAGLGMSSAEIKKQMTEINFTDFMDKDTPFWSEALGFKKID